MSSPNSVFEVVEIRVVLSLQGEPDDPAADSDSWCGGTYLGWTCTLENGHKGVHEAWDDEALLAVWGEL